ncbi:hypothetical protein RchiOBHm_Chr4g0398961 [Rosa chinensis]|uniref:Uncharacterized protein n=1 Tax=Rosa chinensis TaxID=74649 RepID=A0A2P6QSG5_ROSCH|nr:hypothetical protein RchiOBHm_Chr4g0398961 [Rosa chinensis]
MEIRVFIFLDQIKDEDQFQKTRERERASWEFSASDPKPARRTRPALYSPATPRRRTCTISFASASPTSLYPQIVHASTVNGEATTGSSETSPATSAITGASGHHLSCLGQLSYPSWFVFNRNSGSRTQRSNCSIPIC